MATDKDRATTHSTEDATNSGDEVTEAVRAQRERAQRDGDTTQAETLAATLGDQGKSTERE